MDIVKAFNANDLHTEIVIKGTVNDPLFRASDVGVVLEISNIRNQLWILMIQKRYRGTKFPL